MNNFNNFIVSKTYTRGSQMAKGGLVGTGKGKETQKKTVIPDNVKEFMPEFQQRIVRNSDEFQQVVDELSQIISSMPETYQTEDVKKEDKVAHLHYFYGGSDWYIIEKDKGDGDDKRQIQAFGYVILNDDTENAEMGYISIEELKENGKVELDFHFKPQKLSEILNKNNSDPRKDFSTKQQFVQDVAHFVSSFGRYPAYIIENSTILTVYTSASGGTNTFTINKPTVEKARAYAAAIWDAYENGNLSSAKAGNNEAGKFLYGSDWGVPADYSSRLKEYLTDQGFTITNEKSQIIYIEKSGHSMYVNDNGGEFNTGDNKTNEHISNIAYAGSLVPKGIYNPTDLAMEIKESFDKYFFNKYEGEAIDGAIVITTNEDDGGIDWDDYQKYFFVKSAAHQGWATIENKKTGTQLVAGRNNFHVLTTTEIKNHLTEKQVAAIKGSDTSVAEPLTINILAKDKTQHEINQMIRTLIKEKGTDKMKYSAAELNLLQMYEGSGGLAKEGETGARLFDQFFTPDNICQSMWGLALKHGFKFEGSNILEPSSGIGRFLKYIPKDLPSHVDTFEIDETSYKVSQILFPHFTHNFKSFESLFFDKTGKRHLKLAGLQYTYDLVIGNPPYREYISPFAPLGEKAATGAATFDQYFIMRGVDVLKKGGLLIYIIPSSFMFNNKAYNDFKDKLIAKADLVEAFRLPSGIFPNTEVTTDIIVMKKK